MHTPEFMKLKTTSPNWNLENHFPNLHFLGAMFIFPPLSWKGYKYTPGPPLPHPDLSSCIQLCFFGQSATDRLLVGRKVPFSSPIVGGHSTNPFERVTFSPSPKKGHGLNHQANIFFHKFYKLSAVSALDMGILNTWKFYRPNYILGDLPVSFLGCNMHGFVYVIIILRSG